ncbi:MAG: hypothetical protein O7D30_11055 [Rickettsia endosymbiont of Ixodes persulcatus]|nr:hypothetical protein [Rickettsia endosymbiont of Ixodes persulcatus]
MNCAHSRSFGAIITPSNQESPKYQICQIKAHYVNGNPSNQNSNHNVNYA